MTNIPICKKRKSSQFRTISISCQRLPSKLSKQVYLLNFVSHTSKLRKCFVTINHSIVCKKIKKYGFHEYDIDLFRSYLSNRKQIVKCHNEISHMCDIDIGVPQGSALGPILFIMYVNDINQHVHIGAAWNLYADDTLVYCSDNNVDRLRKCTNTSIACIKQWYDMTKLVINTAKSNVMVVSSKKRHGLSGASNIDVRLGNENIKQIDCIEYIGVKLDAHLQWNDQIDAVCRKLVFTISRLSRLRHVLAPRILMYIYQGIIQPRFYYAITIIFLWGFTSKYNLSKFQRLQNRAVRIITRDFDYVHVRRIDIAKNLKWMNVIQIRDYFVALPVFTCIHGMSPSYLSDCITMYNEIAVRDTRASTSSNLVIVPHAHLALFENSFEYRDSAIWNALPEHIIRKCINLHTVKKALRAPVLT